MKYQFRKYLPLFAAILLLLGFSQCRRKDLRWDNGAILPLFHTDLDLGSVNAQYLKNTPSDSSFELVYDKLVYSSQFLKVKTPDTTINTTFNLRRLKLADKSIVQNITLGQINPLFKLFDGQTMDIPAQNQSNLSPVTIDASQFFETATLDSGFLDITIKNELPVVLTNMSFELRNADDNSLVASDNFTNLQPNTTSTKTIDLRGKTVRKSLLGIITSISTQASNGPVLIEANKGVQITLSVHHLLPKSAVAAFPNQTIVDQDAGLVLDMGGPQVKWFKVKAGKLKIRIVSTIQENMHMHFEIPSATLNGNKLLRDIDLPSPANGSNVIDETVVDMTGYLIDFRGKNPNVTDTVNTFHQILKVYLDSSGRKVPIALRDSINIFYQLDELVPEYAIGYMGFSENSTGYAQTPFELFKGAFGKFQLKDFQASVQIRNYIGAEGSIIVHKLDGTNDHTKNKVQLTANPLNNEIFISPAIVLGGNYANVIPSVTNVDLYKANSNITTFVENLPQWLGYDLTIKTCPNGNVNNYKDFATADGRVDVYLHLQVPASFSVEGLTLLDTQNINLSSIAEPNRIKSGKLYIEVENGFPFETSFSGILLDANLQPLDEVTMEGDGKIAAAILQSNGIQTTAVKSRLIINLNRDRAKNLQRAKYIAIKSTIAGSGKVQKIYDTYKIKVGCNVGFEYEVRL